MASRSFVIIPCLIITTGKWFRDSLLSYFFDWVKTAETKINRNKLWHLFLQRFCWYELEPRSG